MKFIERHITFLIIFYLLAHSLLFISLLTIAQPSENSCGTITNHPLSPPPADTWETPNTPKTISRMFPHCRLPLHVLPHHTSDRQARMARTAMIAVMDYGIQDIHQYPTNNKAALSAVC
jgi:hypothetical protein